MTDMYQTKNGIDTSILSVGVFLGLFALIALLIAANPADPMMAFTSSVFLVMIVAFLVGMLMWLGNRSGDVLFDQKIYDNGIIKWGSPPPHSGESSVSLSVLSSPCN